MKRVILHSILFFLILLSCGNGFAQTVTNVEARQEGQTIVITFNMDKPADFDLYFSSSGTYGKFVYIDKEYLDIQRLSDNEYYCRWHVLDQFEEFDNNFVIFRVEPKKSRTAARFLLRLVHCWCSLRVFRYLRCGRGVSKKTQRSRNRKP